jgi:hypothetical protein
MELVLLGFAVPALAIYARRRLGRIERILVFSRDYALPWYEKSDFSFTLSCDGEARARDCIARVQGPGLVALVEPTNVAGRFRAVWKIHARSSGPWYRALCERILAAAAEAGIDAKDHVILSSVSDPGSSQAVLLDNCSFAPGAGGNGGPAVPA